MIKIKDRGNQEIVINNHILRLTNLGKIFWADEKITKSNLLNYYERISDIILPYLVDRPESLNRFPNGIFGKNFYQKNINGQAPDWAETLSIKTEAKQINYLLCQDLETLLFMVNLGCIEINPWNSKKGKLEYPDYFIIDLDPVDISFEYVKKAALIVKEILDELTIPGFPKTSGATGIHIYVPLAGKFTYEQTRLFTEIIVNLVFEKAPSFLSLRRRPAERAGRVYLDYLQNSRGQTLASVYSVRPRIGATVSTPLFWEELKDRKLTPELFNLHNIFKRLDEVGDIFSPVLGKGIDLDKILKQLSKE